MRVISKEELAAACRHMNIKNPGSASIMDIARLSAYLEAKTGNTMIHMELGSPGLPSNKVGIEAEKAALDAGVASKYPPTDGVSVLKEASCRFVKAFLDINLDPLYHVPTTGSMMGAFCSFAAAAQCYPERSKILVLEPSFSANKQQMAVMGIGWESLEVTDLREGDFEDNLRRVLSGRNYSALVYSNPNNPSWMCLSEEELQAIARVAEETETFIIEDLAYFCMDERRDYGTPYKAPYPPTVARYTDKYLMLLSASKIFSYAGQRIGILCIGAGLYNKRFPAFEARYGRAGIFGQNLVHDIIDQITSGVATSTQWGLAAMMNASCNGTLDFRADVSEYFARAKKMKDVFLRHGFTISYEQDAMGKIADGFFFTLSYPGMDSARLVEELLTYGVATVSLVDMGGRRPGVRVCSSRIHGSQFDLLEERISAFQADLG